VSRGLTGETGVRGQGSGNRGREGGVDGRWSEGAGEGEIGRSGCACTRAYGSAEARFITPASKLAGDPGLCARRFMARLKPCP
jgi:hypothetical protein